MPAWLDEPILYHNRGDTTFEGESPELGDFGGLDDLMTENPRVVQGSSTSLAPGSTATASMAIASTPHGT